MRLRNVKNARERLIDNHYFIENPIDNKGLWHKVFGNDNPIHIEIGCGKGQFISTLSKLNPNINYIAIEKFDSVLLRCLEKIINDDIPNLKIAVMDAAVLGTYFADDEVDRIYLNFSDPWPKARHAKRRLTYITNLEKYKRILVGPCDIEMKTDNIGLFEFSLESFKEAGFTILELSYDLHKDKQDIITTEYEDRFSSMGNPINYVHINYKK